MHFFNLWLRISKLEKRADIDKMSEFNKLVPDADLNRDDNVPVYHGTNEVFDKFDPKKGKSGWYHGIYTTSSPEGAKRHGKHIMPFHAHGHFFDMTGKPDLHDKLNKALGNAGSGGSGYPVSRALQNKGYSGIKRGDEHIVFDQKHLTPQQKFQNYQQEHPATQKTPSDFSPKSGETKPHLPHDQMMKLPKKDHHRLSSEHLNHALDAKESGNSDLAKKHHDAANMHDWYAEAQTPPRPQNGVTFGPGERQRAQSRKKLAPQYAEQLHRQLST